MLIDDDDDDDDDERLYLCLASLTTLHLQVPYKLHDCTTVCDHDVPVLIDAACLDCSQLDLSARQVTFSLSSSP